MSPISPTGHHESRGDREFRESTDFARGLLTAAAFILALTTVVSALVYWGIR